MQCEIVQRELNAFIDDQLPWSEARDVEQHLANCASCCARADRIRRLDDLLNDLPAAPVAEGFASRVLGAARRQLRGPVRQREPACFNPWGVARIRLLDTVVAAILVLGLSLGTWMAKNTWPSVETGSLSAGVAARTNQDIGSFYGAVSETFDSQRPLPQAYLIFLDQSQSGE